MQDGRDVARRVHHGDVVAARGRGRLGRVGDRVPHLEQVEPHPGVVLGEDRLKRQRVALGIVLPPALGVDQVADPDHLEQALRRFRRRPELLQVEELQHVEHLDDVRPAVVGGRRAGDPKVAVGPPGRFLPARLPALEVLAGEHAAVRLDDLADRLREVPPVEVVVPLLGEPLQGVGGPLLVEHRVGARDGVAVEEDLASGGGPADLVRLDEDLAPEERVHLEPVPGVGDRVRHQVLPGERAVAVVRRLEPAPPARNRDAAPGGEIMGAVARKRRHRRIHVAVDVGGLAGRLVEIHLGQTAGDRRHVRLDDGLGDRGGERRVAGVPAAFQDVHRGPGRERVGGDRHPAPAFGGALPPEVGELDQAPAFGGAGSGRGGCRSGGKRHAGEAGGPGSEEGSARGTRLHGEPPGGRTYHPRL